MYVHWFLEVGGGLRRNEANEDIFMLGDCPHDWLFEKVSCVVHHSGAGTTAAGITAGHNTLVWRSTVLGRYDSPSLCRAATHSIQETHGRQTGLRDQRSSAARDGY